MIHYQVDGETDGKAYLNVIHCQVEPSETDVALAVMRQFHLLLRLWCGPTCFHEFYYITSSLAYSQISLFACVSEGTSEVDCINPRPLIVNGTSYNLHNFPCIYPFGSNQAMVDFCISH
jgi:hypothetical protein